MDSPFKAFDQIYNYIIKNHFESNILTANRKLKKMGILSYKIIRCEAPYQFVKRLLIPDHIIFTQRADQYISDTKIKIFTGQAKRFFFEQGLPFYKMCGKCMGSGSIFHLVSIYAEPHQRCEKCNGKGYYANTVSVPKV